MINQIVESIVDYTDYLRNALNLCVSFCNISNKFEKYMHILYQFNSHMIGYCDTIKNNPDSFQKCVIKQHKVLEKSSAGAFYGICWAGIEEYVFPIKYGENVLGFISVSGYRGKFDSAISKMKKVSEDFGFKFKDLYQAYMESTSENVPNFNSVKTLIAPLVIMFERLYSEHPEAQVNEIKEVSAYEKILDYVSYNYLQNPTLEKIAQSLNYSVSYVRQLFKKRSGHTIGEHILNLKLRKATWLLTNSSFSVAKIASLSGFVDANYFSAKFKKVLKLTPLEYRKINSTLVNDSSIQETLFKKIYKL